MISLCAGGRTDKGCASRQISGDEDAPRRCAHQLSADDHAIHCTVHGITVLPRVRTAKESQLTGNREYSRTK